MIPSRLGIFLPAALLATAFSAEPPRVDPTTLTGKVMCGYQGWFNAEADGAKRGYNHWTRGGAKPAAGNVRIDLWPDLSEFPPAERFPTALVHADALREASLRRDLPLLWAVAIVPFVVVILGS